MSDEDTPAMTPADLEKLRFDYAWRWFAYHAEQRMKAFNFMILTFGALATAVVTSIDRKLGYVGVVVSVVSMIVAYLFSLLDKRNEKLVDAGRAALRSLETSLKFRGSDESPPVDIVTILYNERSAQNKSSLCDLLAGRHRIVLRAFALLFVALFAITTIIAFQRARAGT